MPGNLWLARALNHMTARAASWVQDALEHSSPSQPFEPKPRWALHTSLQNGPTVGCVCKAPQGG